MKEVTVTVAKNHDQSPKIEESKDDDITVRMLGKEEDEESSNDSLEAPTRRRIPKSSTMKMLDNALLELKKLDFKKNMNPDHSDQNMETKDDTNNPGNVKDASNDSLESPPRSRGDYKRSPSMKMLDDALIELAKLDFKKKKH